LGEAEEWERLSLALLRNSIADHAAAAAHQIDPDGGDKSNAFQVFCDMTTVS
jgi:hypothetical protein